MKEHKDLRALVAHRSYVRLVLLGVIVGILAGGVTVAYRFALVYSEEFSLAAYAWAQTPLRILLLFSVLAILGIAVGLLTRSEPMIRGSGIPQVEGALLGYFDLRWWRVLIKKFAGGAVSILAGLSLGREGPSILLGGMTGQGVSQGLKLSKIEQKYLITCGACAGLAAAFNAPLAGVLFALEEVHKNFSPKVLLSAMAAAITADLVSKLFFGTASTFHVASVELLPPGYYLLLAALGIILGLFGALYNRTLMDTQKLYSNIKLPEPLRMVIPFFIAGVLGLTFPLVLGSGHRIIELLISGEYTVKLLLLLLTAKFLFSMVSFGSGAPGGIFFPLLVLGSLAGAIFGEFAINVAGVPEIYRINFLLFGMVGMFTAIVRAPLTGIILVVEMSGSLTQLLGITVVAAIAYLAAELCRSKPVYTSLLERITPKEVRLSNEEERVAMDFVVGCDSRVQHRQLKDIHWPDGCLVISVDRGGYPIIPHGNTMLLPGDAVTVLCKSGEEAALRKAMANKFS